MDPYVADIDSCFNAGPSHYSATMSTVDLSVLDNVRFEWNQCTDGGLFKIYIWEDNDGFPGDDIFSELQTTDNYSGWNHSIISTSGISTIEDLWVGIREYTATQSIGMDMDNEGCSVVDNGDGWEELEGGNLAYRLTTCLEDNPQGCFETGCPDGYVCMDDWENNCVSTDCDCNENTGYWICDVYCPVIIYRCTNIIKEICGLGTKSMVAL